MTNDRVGEHALGGGGVAAGAGVGHELGAVHQHLGPGPGHGGGGGRAGRGQNTGGDEGRMARPGGGARPDELPLVGAEDVVLEGAGQLQEEVRRRLLLLGGRGGWGGPLWSHRLGGGVGARIISAYRWQTDAHTRSPRKHTT